MKKTLILLIAFLLTFSCSAFAVDGYISLDYNVMDKTGTGEIYLSKNLTQKFIVGGKLTTELMGFNLKEDFIPAGVPESQSYDLILKYKLTDKLTINFTEGCQHYFSQSGISSKKDKSYIKVGAKYEF